MNVNLKLNANCQLVATPIDDWLIDNILDPFASDSEAVVFVEFVVNPKIDSNNTIRVSSTHQYYYYDLPQDGLYVYYKLKIFEKSYVDNNYSGLCYDSKNDILLFKGVELKDVLEILPGIEQAEFGVLDYIKSPIFSICKLQHCLKEMQKKSISQCNNGLCDKSDSDRKMRDFLFITIYVLENLICQERFGEANEILNSVSSCVPICKNISITKSGCNCQ